MDGGVDKPAHRVQLPVFSHAPKVLLLYP